jgi:hypothetical protein
MQIHHRGELASNIRRLPGNELNGTAISRSQLPLNAARSLQAIREIA